MKILVRIGWSAFVVCIALAIFWMIVPPGARMNAVKNWISYRDRETVAIRQMPEMKVISLPKQSRGGIPSGALLGSMNKGQGPKYIMPSAIVMLYSQHVFVDMDAPIADAPSKEYPVKIELTKDGKYNVKGKKYLSQWKSFPPGEMVSAPLMPISKMY